MDLNYLLRRHQVAIMMASAATCREARYSHLGMVASYAARIAELQIELGGTLVLADL